MRKTAKFRFHEALNDFLPHRRKNSWIGYEFYVSPTVKDAIESMGVPHPEVDRVMVNNTAVDFQYHLRDGDIVEVCPGNHQVNEKFILDVHLGTLAKQLRLLGFDACYENDYEDKEIVQIAVAENRIVLTRDILLLKHKVIKYGYWLRSQHPREQIVEVIHYFRLDDKFRPFTRCLECNGPIICIPREAAIGKVPPQIICDLNEFYNCRNCKRVYWKGSHYDKLKMLVERLLRDVQ